LRQKEHMKITFLQPSSHRQRWDIFVTQLAHKN